MVSLPPGAPVTKGRLYSKFIFVKIEEINFCFERRAFWIFAQQERLQIFSLKSTYKIIHIHKGKSISTLSFINYK